MHSALRTFTAAALTSLLSTHALGVVQECVEPPAGLVGWWAGNGDATDSAGGNDGVLLGDATFAPAVVDQGFKLDGVDDAVEIPRSAALEPPTVSVEAWVRFDSLDTPIVSQFGALGTQFIVFKKNTRTFNFEGYSLHKERRDDGDHFAFRVTGADGFGGIALSTTTIVVGEFYHVVGTYDGAEVRLYVNGVLEGQAATSITLDYGTRPVFIGTSGETVFDGKLNGIVDEVSIYNRALTAAEVSQLYAAGAAGKCLSSSMLLGSLIAFVERLNLSTGIANSLEAKLRAALDAIDTGGDTQAGCGLLQAFINEVNAQEGVTLTTEQAARMRNTAQEVRTRLGCQ